MTNNKKMYAALAALVLVSATTTSVLRAQEESSKQESIAEDLAKLMTASRKVITEWQPIINDPDKGDKGLTADVFAQKATANLKEMFSIDISDPKLPKEVQILWEAEKQVVKEAQPVINKKGMGYKGFLPAVFARMSSAKFTAKLPGAYMKLTNYPDVHNKVNTPDAWETNVLKKFLAADYPHGKPYYEVADMNGKKMLRLIQPEYYVKACLNCHGTPKGEKGPGGVIKCGKKEGQAGAGFSIGLPVN